MSVFQTDEELESFLKERDENIEGVTTCLAEHTDGTKEQGVVLTVQGKDVVLLESDLEAIIEYLNIPHYSED